MELFLEDVKQELPELTREIDLKTMSRVDEYFAKLENDLKIQKKLLQENIHLSNYYQLQTYLQFYEKFVLQIGLSMLLDLNQEIFFKLQMMGFQLLK
jgi:hypothetical protein